MTGIELLTSRMNQIAYLNTNTPISTLTKAVMSFTIQIKSEMGGSMPKQLHIHF